MSKSFLFFFSTQKKNIKKENVGIMHNFVSHLFYRGDSDGNI